MAPKLYRNPERRQPSIELTRRPPTARLALYRRSRLALHRILSVIDYTRRQAMGTPSQTERKTREGKKTIPASQAKKTPSGADKKPGGKSK